MQIGNIAALPAHAAETPSTAGPLNSSSPSSSTLGQSILYSASGGGKTYTGDVGLAAGQYTAVVPQLPGISAIGPSRIAAEDRLDLRISVLV